MKSGETTAIKNSRVKGEKPLIFLSNYLFEFSIIEITVSVFTENEKSKMPISSNVNYAILAD